jgi:hypothetical protein
MYSGERRGMNKRKKELDWVGCTKSKRKSDDASKQASPPASCCSCFVHIELLSFAPLGWLISWTVFDSFDKQTVTCAFVFASFPVFVGSLSSGFTL